MLSLSSANLVAFNLYLVLKYELLFCWHETEMHQCPCFQNKMKGKMTCVIYIFLNITEIKYLIRQFTHHISA